MSRRIKITGVKELKAALDGNVLKFPKQVNDIVHKHGARLQNQTQSNMDRAYIRGYSTGATKRSTTITNSNFKSEVQPHTEYFPYLEYGTRFMSRRPTLGPAFSKIEPGFRQEITKLMK